MGTRQRQQENNPPESDEQIKHPSEDRSNRFAVDALIRRHGYEIWERKKGQDPVWIKYPQGTREPSQAIKFLQSDILIRIDEWIIKDAVYLEDMDAEARLYV